MRNVTELAHDPERAPEIPAPNRRSDSNTPIEESKTSPPVVPAKRVREENPARVPAASRMRTNASLTRANDPPFVQCRHIKENGIQCGWNSWSDSPHARPFRYGSLYCTFHLPEGWTPATRN